MWQFLRRRVNMRNLGPYVTNLIARVRWKSGAPITLSKWPSLIYQTISAYPFLDKALTGADIQTISSSFSPSLPYLTEARRLGDKSPNMLFEAAANNFSMIGARWKTWFKAKKVFKYRRSYGKCKNETIWKALSLVRKNSCKYFCFFVNYINGIASENQFC